VAGSLIADDIVYTNIVSPYSGTFTRFTGRFGINSIAPQGNLSIVSSSAFGLNAFNFTQSDVNTIRSSWSEATDTSSFNLSFLATGEPEVNLVNQAGVKVLNINSLGTLQWNNGGEIGTSATTTTFINGATNVIIRTGGSSRYTATITSFTGTADNTRDLGSTGVSWRFGYINSVLSNGTADRTWGVSDNTTANTAGSNFLLSGSGATTGATDKNGGMVTFSPGTSTGTGFASIRLQSSERAASTGTTRNALVDRIIVASPNFCADNTATTLFNVVNALGTSFGITIQYTIETIGGAGNESHTETGMVFFNGANDGATTSTSSKASSVQYKTNAGTYTVTFTQTNANPAVISVTADSDLNVTSKIYYTIINSDGKVITQL
jgi:hypothetical protein